jgi:hypothetical protein
MGIKIEDLVPVLGMMNGKGWAGDMFGKKSQIEEQQNAIAKQAADQKAAQDKAAQEARSSQWANRPAMKKGGAVKKADGGSVYTEKMGKPPQDVDGASVRKSSKRDQPEQLGEGIRTEKKAKGGMTGTSASRRADGMASRGKTRGKMC